MSKKTREKKAAAAEARDGDPLVRRLRLAGLWILVALQWCCVAGSQGAWWQALYRGQPVGDPTAGNGDPWGLLIAVAALVGFFFASYDLVSSDDIHLPILGASLVVALAAGRVFHRVWVSESTIESIAREVGDAQQKGKLLPPPPDTAPVASDSIAVLGSSDQVAPEVVSVQDDDVLTSRGLSLQFRWGLALILSAAPLMVVVSAALLFLARRAPEPAT